MQLKFLIVNTLKSINTLTAFFKHLLHISYVIYTKKRYKYKKKYENKILMSKLQVVAGAPCSSRSR